MARKISPALLIVDGPEDIPDFPDEGAESLFWGTHRLSDRLLAEMRPPTEEEAPIPPRHTRAISLRMDEGVLERLQALATSSGRHYQSLLKQFVAERLELEELKVKEAVAKEARMAAVQRMNGVNLHRVERTVISRIGDDPPAHVLIAYSPNMSVKAQERLGAIIHSLGVDPESIGERDMEITIEDVDDTILLEG